ncbi:MAG: hypothetical protein GY856_35435, partial [bacterium]|nr:hypothetical protein [bacterium]
VNMELVAECADRVRDPDLRAVTVAGLIARYAAVDRQLAGSARTPAELVRDGAETILVVPTMAYVIAAWIAASRSAVAVSALVRDGLLAGALFDAAAVIRLANDLGTGLVERSAADHEQLGRELLRADEHQGAGSFSERLARFSESSELLSRIRKDVVYGEFNLGLDNLAADQPVARSVERFVANLVHYSTLYQRRRRTLGEGLAEIVRRTGERRIGEVVERFVSFHERLYRHRFEAAEGEYAI